MNETNSGYMVGSTVPIFYNPQNYKEGFINNNLILFFSFTVLLATLFSSLFLILKYKSQTKKKY